MYYNRDILQEYLVQIRRIAQSREKDAERRIHKIYNDLIKDLQGFLGEQYTKYADDEDVLSIALLQQKGIYARFIEEVNKRINITVPIANKEIKETVEKVYTICYNGLVEGVKKSITNKDLNNNLKEIEGCTPEVAKRAVENPVNGIKLNKTLEKNRKEIIYDINREITTGLNQGDRYGTVTRRLTDKVNMSYNKAMRIVRTETHKVCEGGIHDASTSVDEILIKNPEYGLRMVKTWRNVGDSSVRPGKDLEKGSKKKGKIKAIKNKSGITKNIVKIIKKSSKKPLTGGVPNHIIMDNQTVLQNEMFDLGDGVKAIAPGYSGVAGHDCNCRCFIVVDLMTEDEFFEATGRRFNKNIDNKLDKSSENDIIKNKNKYIPIDLSFFRNGKDRAIEYEKYWSKESLSKQIKKYVPEYQIKENKDKGKIIYYENNKKIQIVYDTNGDYFRIEDSSRKDARRYYDINGNDVSNIKDEKTGKFRGATKAEYQALTHFKNIDND